MNGAETLVHTLIDGNVDTCFANPGTSEMHFVSALDRIEGMHCVLGLHETVVTGAADGYYRMADRPAATLLHLGPGLANGLANLHNAKKARSGIVNIVGDHAVDHLKLDAPLTSDIHGIAGPVSHWVHTIPSVNSIAADGREAIRQANDRPGRIATLILPANVAWTEATTERPIEALPAQAASILSADFDRVVNALRSDPQPTLLLLGGRALRAECTTLAGKIAAATGASLRAEFYYARHERGAGRVIVPRIPYAVDSALAVLANFKRIVLVNAKEPVAFFAYPDKPGRLTTPGCEVLTLSTVEDDAEVALSALCEAVGGSRLAPKGVAQASTASTGLSGALNADGIAHVVAATLPEGAIVIDEAVTSGRSCDTLTATAAPHDWLTGCGGAIGFGLPTALGAAIAAPERRVLSLEGDGSGMYSLQALWSMARENLNITVVVFVNRAYGILRGELAAVGAGVPGERATDMLSLDRPAIDWSGLAKAMGVNAVQVSDLDAFGKELQRSYRTAGPTFIEAVL
jgi:acetolactate synthase-1/2/3 large subunit